MKEVDRRESYRWEIKTDFLLAGKEVDRRENYRREIKRTLYMYILSKTTLEKNKYVLTCSGTVVVYHHLRDSLTTYSQPTRRTIINCPGLEGPVNDGLISSRYDFGKKNS